MAEDTATRTLEALQVAPSQQLYQMRLLIDTFLAEPKWTMAARPNLHLGHAVQLVDFRTGQIRPGKLIARHNTQATVIDESVRRSWKIPDVAIARADLVTPCTQSKPHEPPPEPAAPDGQCEIELGDKVTFDDAKGATQVGMVKPVNWRTAPLETMDGWTWREDFQLLRHVVEV